ncbi:hypothetical protein C8P68_1159 [Mucilaginibacter yixingensis]|uniref:Uncharacterized protein n=1 Tax=Mucilaginibacter yixingensis TaxID=1295612 RepID=A0A2T5J4G2_9SPHI|nr:hypothetical protein [Mucilaginibacter yixingensis]PTQ92013.1 hypothetical protein C8P68_1159 [Mucilaginibacter yixingensis]
MECGDIFFAPARYRTRAEAWHPIIYWGEHDVDHFIGLRVTHGRSERYSDNVRLQDERYFEFCSGDFSDS